MSFTPIESLLGGITIGLAVYWNARLNGKVTGISGAVNATLAGDSFSAAFISGLVCGGVMFRAVIPTPFVPDTLANIPLSRLLVAAFLVGFGTRLGNGCTSGHGVCGLSRFSRRSFISVCTFMTTAALTATALSSSRFFSSNAFKGVPPVLRLTAKPPEHELPWMLGFIALAVVIPPLLSSVYEEANKDTSHSDSLLKEAIQFVLGLFFAAGLITSGMVNPEKVIRFLDLSSPHWDPSLLFVFIGALPLGIVGFRPMLQGTKPVLAATTSFPTRTDIDMPLIIGAILFGIGWGAAGVCPGPALVQFGAHLTSRHTIGFVLTMILGSLSCSAVQ